MQLDVNVLLSRSRMSCSRLRMELDVIVSHVAFAGRLRRELDNMNAHLLLSVVCGCTSITFVKDDDRNPHGTTRRGTARHGTARHGTTRHDATRHGTARHGTARRPRAFQNDDRHPYEHLGFSSIR